MIRSCFDLVLRQLFCYLDYFVTGIVTLLSFSCVALLYFSNLEEQF